MKSTSAIAALALTISGANAFVAPAAPTFGTPLRSSTEDVQEVEVEAAAPAETVAEEVQAVPELAEKVWGAPTPKGPQGMAMSEAVPFLERPRGLDTVKLAGDRGFDPFGFAGDKATLLNRREAEVRHGRIAMLAAAGWPIAELFDKPLANLIGASSPIADNAGFSPSILNGGLDLVSPFYWGAVIALTAAVEIYGGKVKAAAGPDYIPGDLGFDPVGFYPADAEGRMAMQEKEIRHGRLAMLGIVGFAFQEFFLKSPVVNETPIFFEPIW
ncbi:unnamed protein product, partial [Chrysoparadoxa australica]